MKRKAQVDVVLSAVALLLVVVVGGIQTYQGVTANRYVAYSESKTIYDLTKCSVKDLDQSKLIPVEDVDEKIAQGYVLAKCD